MSAAHHPGVSHHPGLHLGPIDIEWGSLVVPLVTLAMFIVLAYLLANPPLEFPATTLVDPNLAP